MEDDIHRILGYNNIVELNLLFTINQVEDKIVIAAFVDFKIEGQGLILNCDGRSPNAGAERFRRFPPGQASHQAMAQYECNSNSTHSLDFESKNTKMREMIYNSRQCGIIGKNHQPQSIL
jgi:hypothetical protein